MFWTKRYLAICVLIGIVDSLTFSPAWGQDQAPEVTSDQSDEHRFAYNFSPGSIVAFYPGIGVALFNFD